MNKTLSLLCLLASSQLLACWNAQHEPTAGSQTHFLATCDTSCSAPYACLCGVCTLACSGDSQCRAVAAKSLCLPPTAAAGAPCTTDAVCDLECTRGSDCSGLGAGYDCVAERCRAIATMNGSGRDAAAAPPNGEDGSTPQSLVDGAVSRIADGSAPQSLVDAAGMADAGPAANCVRDSDCVFHAESSCCGECLAPLQPVTAHPPTCVLACAGPPGGCSCVNHRCARGGLVRGDSCDPAHDACGSGLGCCPTCLPHGPGDGGTCSGRGPQCSPLSSFDPKSCPLL